METNKKILAVVAALIVVLGILYYLNVFSFSFFSKNTYQAVFLTNGQVYFGKLYQPKSQYAILKNVFYLQIAQAPQPIKAGETPPANINLVKLGGELHGPTDEMRINRDHILFVEDLKPDSRVVQAIEQFKGSQ
jgi:hypothetical protein